MRGKKAFDALNMKLKIVAAAAVVSSGMFSANLALAGTVVQCGAAVCSQAFNIQFNGNTQGTGELLYDARTGAISLNTDLTSITGPAEVLNGGIVWTMGDSSTVSINSLSGNADPILSFGVGATTQSSSATFAFAFDLPVAIAGPINASSSVSYSLTSTTSAGAQIGSIGGNVVKAWEVDTSVGGLSSLNKGVDVGDTFFFTGGPLTQNSPVYTASNSFTGDLAYDLMSLQIGFSLSANSSVGMSGFVSQTVVPVPAAVWLFGSGLLGLIGIARRKKVA